ncbi:MAG: zinc metallopeptidase [Clostridiales bacterium]|nr:zinc metallopeptidase [Clostridiales bacterium]
MPLFFIDYWYIVLVVPVLILSLIIQAVMKSTYRKYSAVRAHAGCTGAEMARRVLKENGIYEVNVVPIEGELSDHYDPRSRVIRLSGNVYNGSSVAALGVACHEAGHAVQHAQAYVPLTARNAIAPVVNFCSGISWFVLITLPVEFNASRRAISALRKSGLLSEDELGGTKKVLTAAAMTYVAALATSIASLIRVILLTRNNRRE